MFDTEPIAKQSATSMERSRCASCTAEELEHILDLGMHPMADTFIPAERASEGDRLYPLECDLCARCGQIQLRTVTDPDERYSHFEYSYTSSNSEVARRHWTDYARDVVGRTGVRPGSLVVELGSNDGYLCDALRKHGVDTLGVDPSGAMCRLAAERGVETLQGFFTSAVANEIVSRKGRPADLIVANNVLNHANEPREFVQAVKELLAPGGTFVFQVPYWLRMVEDRKLDQIYHEHVSYFTVTSACNLLRPFGMQVSHVEEVAYHGTSIRVFAVHSTGAGAAVPSPDVARLRALESERGVLRASTYKELAGRMAAARHGFLRKLYTLKEAGHSIVCIGAAAKGNTFLNYYRLDRTVIDLVTDASPSKIGKFTPGTRIPIEPDSALSHYGKVYAIITSWNIADALRPMLSKINAEIEFLNPYEDER
jgi:SAM-dependent methyltransferase